MFLPVVGTKPVERGIELDDVCSKQNKITNLREHMEQFKLVLLRHLFQTPNFPCEYQHLEFSFCHKIGREQGAGEQTCSDDQVLGLVEEGQGGLCLPL